MVFPMRWPEPFGLVMIEAMACGTPVVTTNWGAAPELVEDGLTGFSPRRRGRPRGDDRPGRQPQPCRVPALVEERFSGEAMVRGYEAVYERALGSPTRRFHYTRSVITLCVWRADPPAAREPARLTPALEVVDLTWPSTTVRSCGRHVGRRARSTPRPDGPQRLRQVDPGQHAAR